MRAYLIQLLGRVTSGQRLIPEIDGLRLFAILTVVAYHANIQACRTFNPGINDASLADAMKFSIFNQVLARGNVGVPVFFAISGFILALPFARYHRINGSPPVQLRSYFLRRLSRLEVPYLVALAIMFVAGAVAGKGWVWGHLVASALYVHMFVFGQFSTINPVLWSLEIEVCFYCIAPVLTTVFSLRSMKTRLAIIAAMMVPSIIMRSYFDNDLSRVHLDMTILGYGFYFLTGFLALELYLSGYLIRGRGGAIFDLLGLIGIIGLLWPGELSKFLNALVFVPSCLALFLAAFRGVLLRSFFTNVWVVIIGGMCYSIYLLHYGIMILVTKEIGQFLVISNQEWFVTVIFLLIMVPVSVAPCVGFFLLVEKPCMKREWFPNLVAKFRSISSPHVPTLKE